MTNGRDAKSQDTWWNAISIHPLFFLFVLFAYTFGFMAELLLFIAIVFLHELGHALAARYFGWRVRKIELFPFGGAVQVDESGNRPWREELLVILAGPAVNLFLALSTWFLYQAGLWTSPTSLQFIEYNLILFLFNLIPIVPLDGGKLLQLLLALKFPYRTSLDVSYYVSLGCLLLYFIFLILSPPYFYLWFLGCWFIFALYLEKRQIPYQHLRFLLSRHRGTPKSMDLIDKRMPVSREMTTLDATKAFYKHCHHIFYTYDSSTGTYLSCLEKEILDTLFNKHCSDCAVRELLR